jgi:hypothetical protein
LSFEKKGIDGDEMEAEMSPISYLFLLQVLHTNTKKKKDNYFDGSMKSE